MKNNDNLRSEISDLRDAIKHCEEVACSANSTCAAEHLKLRGWLEEVLQSRMAIVNGQFENNQN